MLKTAKRNVWLLTADRRRVWRQELTIHPHIYARTQWHVLQHCTMLRCQHIKTSRLVQLSPVCFGTCVCECVCEAWSQKATVSLSLWWLLSLSLSLTPSLSLSLLSAAEDVRVKAHNFPNGNSQTQILLWRCVLKAASCLRATKPLFTEDILQVKRPTQDQLKKRPTHFLSPCH